MKNCDLIDAMMNKIQDMGRAEERLISIMNRIVNDIKRESGCQKSKVDPFCYESVKGLFQNDLKMGILYMQLWDVLSILSNDNSEDEEQ